MTLSSHKGWAPSFVPIVDLQIISKNKKNQAVLKKTLRKSNIKNYLVFRFYVIDLF